MHPIVRRWTSALCIVLLLESTTTCRVRQQIPSISATRDGQLSRERLVAITLRNGRYVKFLMDRRVELRNDSLFAPVRLQTKRSVGVSRTVLVVEGFAIADVERWWGSRVSVGRTVGAVALVFVVGVLFLAAIIAASSCPFVYSWDGEQWVLDAEPYGGSVTRGLERWDVARLEHASVDSAGLYRLMMKNEAEETQFTNEMRLLLVDHAPGTRIEIDETGTVRAMPVVLPPSRATDRVGADLLPWLRATDHSIREPTPPADPRDPVREEVTLTFPKPADASRAVLVANALTSEWGAHMLRELLLLRGASVRDWYAAIDTSATNRELLHQWNLREELWMLQVLVEEPDGWRARGLLGGGGPYAAETRAVPLDVSRVRGDSVRIRIRPPMGFWALNSFAISYATDPRFAVDTVAPAEARTADGRDVMRDLAATDDRYYEMPQVGDSGFVSFRAPPARAGLERDVFLIIRGYYRLHLPESGPADLVTLARITNEPDAAGRLSAERYARRRVAQAAH